MFIKTLKEWIAFSLMEAALHQQTAQLHPSVSVADPCMWDMQLTHHDDNCIFTHGGSTCIHTYKYLLILCFTFWHWIIVLPNLATKTWVEKPGAG